MLDNLYISASIRLRKMRDSIKDFFENQSGIGNVVATIIILLIAVLLIAAFWGQLKVFVKKIMDTIFGTEFTSEGLE